MSGYSGYSKSNRAVRAEAEGRFPMTKAAALVAKATGLKRADAKALLERLHDGEWHHTSKMYNGVSYYDAEGAIEHHRLSLFVADLPADWREPLAAAEGPPVEGSVYEQVARRHAYFITVAERHASDLGVSADDLMDAYRADL